ncbi:MAG: Gfo/Idh/MocA family oxidoreductase [Thalassovita sp.]
MTTKPVRWGILGAANFAKQHMAPAIHAAVGAELVAVASSSAEKVEAFQAFAPGVKHHESYDALLADPDIDAVYVPLPNHLHVEWAIKALEAGKPVLCEKPVGMTAQQVDELIAARDKAGLLAAEAFMIVHHPQWQRAKALLSVGAVGKLMHVNAAFSFRNEDLSNIRNQAQFGGGGLRDIGVYTMGSVRYATGQDPSDMAYARIKVENGVDIFADVGFDFPDFTYQGFTGIRMANRQEVHFHGDEAVLTLSCPFNANVFDQAEVKLSYPDGRVKTERFAGVNHYVLQVQNFGDSLRNGTEYPWSLEQARGTQEMLDRVLAEIA